MHESAILSFPPPIYIAHPSAIRLHDYCATYGEQLHQRRQSFAREVACERHAARRVEMEINPVNASFKTPGHRATANKRDCALIGPPLARATNRLRRTRRFLFPSRTRD